MLFSLFPNHWQSPQPSTQTPAAYTHHDQPYIETEIATALEHHIRHQAWDYAVNSSSNPEDPFWWAPHNASSKLTTCNTIQDFSFANGYPCALPEFLIIKAKMKQNIDQWRMVCDYFVFPEINSQIKCLHPSPCLRIPLKEPKLRHLSNCVRPNLLCFLS